MSIDKLEAEEARGGGKGGDQGRAARRYLHGYRYAIDGILVHTVARKKPGTSSALKSGSTNAARVSSQPDPCKPTGESIYTFANPGQRIQLPVRCEYCQPAKGWGEMLGVPGLGGLGGVCATSLKRGGDIGDGYGDR